MIIETKKEKKKKKIRVNKSWDKSCNFLFFSFFLRNKSCNFISRKFSVLKGTFRFIKPKSKCEVWLEDTCSFSV